MKKIFSFGLFGFLIMLAALLCGCTSSNTTEDELPGGVSMDISVDSGQEPSEYVKVWKIISYAATNNVQLSDIEFRIKTKDLGTVIFSGSATLSQEYKEPSSTGVIIWDYFNDGFGSSDRIIVRLPEFGGYVMSIHYGTGTLYDTGFFIQAPSDNQNNIDDNNNGNGGTTPTAENVIDISVSNHVGYDVKVNISVELEVHSSITVENNTTGTKEIEGRKGVVIILTYTVIGNDDITLESDSFFDVDSYVNVNLFPEGSSMNSYQ